MVAKGFMAAAAIIICCATTLRGNDQETKCSGGDCPKACCDKEKCSAEKTACADGKCDDKEECCKKEQVSLEKCSKEKCSKEQVSLEKCSTEKCATQKCSTGKCAKSKCSAGTCEKEKCSTEKCSAEKCTAGKTCGEKCAFTTTLGGLCEPLRCALEATPVSIGVTVETCSKSECNASNCEGEACPVAACASQVCDALKCAVQSCTTECADDCSANTVCATGACGTTQCATQQCNSQDCPAGECYGGVCSVEGTSGLRCGLNASLTASGGEIVFKTEKWFPGTPVAEKCSAEAECSKADCTAKWPAQSVHEFMTAKCPQETCETSKCSTEPVATLNCTDSDCGTENCTAAGEELNAKIAELRQLEREVAALRQQSGTPEQLSVNVKVVEVNVTKCRSLGFEFDTAAAASDLSDAIKISPDILVALEKRNLAKVCADPTLVVISGRPARFHAGGEFPVSDATGRTQFKEFGTKVDVLATALGGRKVELDIRPEFSEIQGNCGPAPCPALSARRWDSSCVTTLGTPLVLSSGSERRVVSKTVSDDRQNPPQSKAMEEVEEVQFFAVVTVRGIGEQAESKTIRQAAYDDDGSSEYERKLVAEVQDPEFITRVYPVPDLQVWKVRPQGVEFDADLLTAHVKATIAPHSWRGAVYSNPAQAEHASGEIRPFERNGSLVVCQTEENHKKIANLFQKMRTDSLQKDAAREERDLHDGSVTPASAEESVSQETKCTKGDCSKENCSESKGACSGEKCNGAKCSKSQVGLETEPADECPGDCQGKCNGECPETVECPCIGGACTR